VTYIIVVNRTFRSPNQVTVEKQNF